MHGRQITRLWSLRLWSLFDTMTFKIATGIAVVRQMLSQRTPCFHHAHGASKALSLLRRVGLIAPSRPHAAIQTVATATNTARGLQSLPESLDN